MNFQNCDHDIDFKKLNIIGENEIVGLKEVVSPVDLTLHHINIQTIAVYQREELLLTETFQLNAWS